MIASIQALRGVAALAVLLYHAAVTAGHNAGYAAAPSNTGAAGVDLFFVISGFVLTLAHYDDFGRAGKPVAFLRRRITRVVPMYWTVTTVLVALLFFAPGLFNQTTFSLRDTLASYLFIQSRISNGGIGVIHAAGWTLTFEAFFYLLFFVALCLGRRWLLVGLPILLLAGVATGFEQPALLVWSSSLSLEFVFGIWIGAATRAGWRLPAMHAAVLGLLAVGAIIVSGEGGLVAGHLDPWRFLIWGVPAAAIVAAAVGLEHAGLRTPRLLVALGASSYSLYLIHALTLPAVAKGWRLLGWHEAVPAGVFVATVIALTVVVAHLFHLMVEAPLTRRLNARWSGTALR